MRTWLKCQIWYLLLWTKYVKCPSLPFSIYLVKLSTSVRVMKTTTKKPFIPILFVSSTWALWVEHSTQVLQKKKKKNKKRGLRMLFDTMQRRRNTIFPTNTHETWESLIQKQSAVTQVFTFGMDVVSDGYHLYWLIFRLIKLYNIFNLHLFIIVFQL